MADVLSKGSLFPEELIPDFIQKTKGASALAKLCGATPIPFNGMKEFTFQLDKKVDVVAENGAKGKGGVTVEPITIVPIKVEYGARISDEFLYANESMQLDYMSAFADGFAKKVAKGIDLMAFHGVNPRTGTASTVIGSNHFDSKATQKVTIATGDKPDANIEAAIALVQGSDRDVTGLVLAPAFKSSLAAQLKSDGAKLYPELAWGNNPGSINGLQVESTSNLSANSSLDRALVGDFASAFKWGYAKEIPIEVIKYGNPDNDATLGDLKGHNQIYLRGEMYIGWGILDASAFAFVKAGA
ncbi:MAG: phage major capsid protein [Clostridia bacterium]|nr:phage major capsid protein [Clostridia bacterium]